MIGQVPFKPLGVFKELFLNPGLSVTYTNLAAWAEEAGYTKLAALSKGASELTEEVEAEFNRMCIGPYKLVVVPYETVWVTGSKKLNGPVGASVADFYASAGLSSASKLNEFPDFFGNELEFVYFLEVVAEEKSKEENSAALVKEIHGLANAFRTEHLNKWFDPFLTALAQHTTHDFWKEASNVLKEILQEQVTQMSPN